MTLFQLDNPRPITDGVRLRRRALPLQAPPSMVRRLVAYWRMHADDTARFHEGWYYRAHSWCEGMAREYNVPLRSVAGIVAALSPGCSWERNLEDAESILLVGTSEYLQRESVKCGTYRTNVEKAWKIFDNPDEDPAGILAPKPWRSGQKTLAFYRNIIQPYLRTRPCIDRHAVSVALGRKATGKERSLSGRRYAMLGNAFTTAARTVGVPPGQFQAVTWELWRDGKRV